MTNRSSREFNFTVYTENLIRLDIYIFNEINKIYPNEYSRSQVSESIKNKLCFVNNLLQSKSGYKVRIGDKIKLTIQINHTDVTADPSVKFEVCFEDDDILVISKPSGLVVHPAPGTKTTTLVNGLRSYLYKDILMQEFDEPERIGIVHRLDKDTSGLMVIAKNMNAKRNLQSQLLPPRSMKRVYHAISCGKVKNKKGVQWSADDNENLFVKAPLTRDEKNRIRYKVEFKEDKFKIRNAESIFRIIETNNNFHLIECELLTGRTHQIRAHLEYIGLPIIGDKVYNKDLMIEPSLKKIIDKIGVNGQLLHAKELSFYHPASSVLLKFKSSYPSAFMKTLLHLDLIHPEQ